MLALIPAFAGMTLAQSGVFAAGYWFPWDPISVSPGQVITLFVRGLHRPMGSVDVQAAGLPLPAVLAGISVRVDRSIAGYPTLLPIFSVRTRGDPIGINGALTAVTVQIPTEPTCASGDEAFWCSGMAHLVPLVVEENGQPGERFAINIGEAAPHLLNSCDTVVVSGYLCYPIVTHANGSLVWSGSGSSGSGSTVAGHPGEVIVVYAVGLGQTQPVVATGLPAPSPAPVAKKPAMELVYPSDSTGSVLQAVRLTPEYAGLVAGFVGLYQINVRLPSTVPASAFECKGAGSVYARLRLVPEDPGQHPFGYDEFCIAP